LKTKLKVKMKCWCWWEPKKTYWK